MAEQGRIHIGTSGWHYDHWAGPFYPDDLPKPKWLVHYAEHFRTAEINNSFYRLPERATLAAWRDEVPRGFVFAVKANRYLTHMKKLKDPGESLANMLERFEVLGEKLGPILFQLPPKWRVNPERLASFLDLLPAGHRYAFEFRDPSWFDDRVYDQLGEHGAAFCIYHLAGRVSPKPLTADFVYLRLHGPGAAYEGRYGAKGLAPWAGACSSWARQGRAIYVYFDNDQRGYAVEDALRLRQMLED